MVANKPLTGPIIECVPNFSEGRRPEIIQTIVNEIDSIKGVKVLDLHSDPDHNRSVVTFIGKPSAVVEAALAGVRASSRLIDLTKHEGVHPRIGAADVVPLIPVRDSCMEDCIGSARELAKRIWNELEIPTYLYGYAALRDDRTRLEKVRLKGFEQMRDLVKRDKSKRPDFGGTELHPTAGATIVGARDYLIAFNVNLKSKDLRAADDIAKSVREKASGLVGLKAMGLMLASGKCAQVSMNITRADVVSPYAAYMKVKEEADKRGIEVLGSELVGLMPLSAAIESIKCGVKLSELSPSKIVELNL